MTQSRGLRPRILVVDDEARLLRLVTSILDAAGFVTVTAKTGEEALERTATQNPNLIILDIMLPGPLDGIAICRRLREFTTVPILMLTAKAAEADELASLEAGADDFIRKPFSAAALVARLRAALRRHRTAEAGASTVTVGPIVIDLARHEVRRSGQLVPLTPTEFRLLKELAVHAGKVLLHSDMLARVWGAEYRDDVDYLRTYIRALRRKLEANPAAPCLIVTKPGVGYMLAVLEKPTSENPKGAS